MKRIPFFLLIVFLTANSFAQDKTAAAQKAYDKKDYKTAFTLAKEILDAGDAAGANRLFIQLREINFDPKIYEYLGDSYTKMGVNELAIINYEEAEKNDSLNVDLKFKTADVMIKQKKYTDAINKYLKIQAIAPANPKAFLEAATILFKAKMFPDAAKMYEGYLKLEQSQDAYENITRSFFEARNWESTYLYGIKCVELYGGTPIINRYVATAALQTKRFEDAAKFYSQVPDSLLSVNELERVGRTFQMVNDNATAMLYFEKVIRLDSTRSSIYFELGTNFFRQKDYEGAVKYFSAKTQADSTHEQSYRFMGFAYYQMGKHEEARANLLKSVALNPKEINTVYFLALSYRGLDSLDRAADVYKEIIELIGDNEAEHKDKILEANAFLASRMMVKKAWAGAIPYLNKVEKLKPSLDVFRMLASCHLSAGNNDAAINYAKRVLKSNPNDADMKKILRVLSAD
ncbi:MAG: TPR Domain containing protein [Ignavibacteria bacterium]|nr:MAG: TPR Domain containing protein [Ignavibacteria bacterium]KAF0160535.1 MAG: TPR Domain containing protein [Ignavibacteria bacterium]